MNKEISLKIKQLQFLLCVLIVVLHSMSFNYSAVFYASWYDLFQQALAGGICQVPVPLFYFLSAYLFFWNCDGWEGIFKKIKSRIHRLLVPYLIWNTIWEIYYVLLFQLGISEKNFSAYKWFDYLKDVILSTNTALWFVKWLCLFVFLAPLIFYVLKHKNLFVAVLLLSLTGLLSEKVVYYTPFYWLPIYLIGGKLGIHSNLIEEWYEEQKNKKNGVRIIFCAFLVLVAALMVVVYDGRYSWMFVRYVGAGAFLYAFLLFPAVNFEWRVMEYSYPIYILHVPICGMLKHLFGSAAFLFLPISMTSIASCVIVVEILRRFWPLGYSVLFGKKHA